MISTTNMFPFVAVAVDQQQQMLLNYTAKPEPEDINDDNDILTENYAWVDQLLAEKFNNYALTSFNCDEFDEAGLLCENYAWVDDLLDEMYNSARYLLESDEDEDKDNTNLPMVQSFFVFWAYINQA